MQVIFRLRLQSWTNLLLRAHFFGRGILFARPIENAKTKANKKNKKNKKKRARKIKLNVHVRIKKQLETTIFVLN